MLHMAARLEADGSYQTVSPLQQESSLGGFWRSSLQLPENSDGANSCCTSGVWKLGALCCPQQPSAELSCVMFWQHAALTLCRPQAHQSWSCQVPDSKAGS